VAFARANGPKKLGIMQSLSASTPNWSENEIPPVKQEASPPNEQELEAMKQAAAVAQAEVVEARQVAQQADSEEEKRRAEEKMDAASKRLTQANSALAAIPVRGLDVHEHPPLLEQALRESKQRLLIISPWIRAKVVNRSFVRQLENLLKRNVKVFIGYGLGEEDTQMNESDRRAEQDLDNLASRFAHFAFVRLGDTHAKILISDRRFIVTTSFNWLSFRGDPNRTFRDEQGMFVGVAELVDNRFDHLASRFVTPQDSDEDLPPPAT
jgi:phosphatidylserine/phosphatidylglycerophosphate/cardiolipin synthase-like enzyme